MKRQVLLLTDNALQLERFRTLVAHQNTEHRLNTTLHYAYSAGNRAFEQQFAHVDWITPLRVKDRIEELKTTYNLIISLHCKQLFPATLVNAVRCVNVHPGLNPHNRGWFPQVFSIINGLPCGATIHEMNEELDRGPVIWQQEVPIFEHDTSFTAYHRILDAEIALLRLHLDDLIEGSYKTHPTASGNLNLKKDFDSLCALDLDHHGTLREHLNLLRALTHGDYANAWFRDRNGKKVFVKTILEHKEEN